MRRTTVRPKRHGRRARRRPGDLRAGFGYRFSGEARPAAKGPSGLPQREIADEKREREEEPGPPGRSEAPGVSRVQGGDRVDPFPAAEGGSGAEVAGTGAREIERRGIADVDRGDRSHAVPRDADRVGALGCGEDAEMATVAGGDERQRRRFADVRHELRPVLRLPVIAHELGGDADDVAVAVEEDVSPGPAMPGRKARTAWAHSSAYCGASSHRSVPGPAPCVAKARTRPMP